MAIPVNELLNWDEGAPYGGVQGAENTNNVLGELLYWDDGAPYVYVFPTASNPPPEVVSTGQFLMLMGIGS